jgi:hypothetical protein
MKERGEMPMCGGGEWVKQKPHDHVNFIFDDWSLEVLSIAFD